MTRVLLEDDTTWPDDLYARAMRMLLRWGTRLLHVWVLVALAATAVACTLIAHPTMHRGGLEGAVSWVTFLGSWTCGGLFLAVGTAMVVRFVLLAVRATNARIARLVGALAAERQARAADAVLAERARIAGEMHDVVGHSLSVISLQAQAAAAALDHDPELVRAPLAAIAESTRAAMVEVRRLVTVLQTDGDTAPAPALSELVALTAEHRASGLHVDLAVVGAAGVPVGVQLAAYRIVQEGLTNVRRHTAATSACVRVECSATRARIEVVDPGPPVRADLPGGFGLTGVRARVTSFGGTFRAGPRGDGWALCAELPYDAAPA